MDKGDMLKLVGGVSSATVRRGSNPPLLPPRVPDPETAILEEDISHNQCLQDVSTANWDAFSTMDPTNQNSEPAPCCQSPMFEFEFKYTTQNARFEPTNQVKLNYNPILPHSEPPDDQTHISSPTNSAPNLELFPEEFEQDAHSFQSTRSFPAADPMSHCHDNRIADKNLEFTSLVNLESEESKMPEILSGKTAGKRILKPLTSVPEDYCPPKKPKWSSTSSKDSFNLSPQTDQSDSRIYNFNQSNRSTSEAVPPIAAKLKPLLSFPSESQIETDQSDHSVRSQGDQSDSPHQSGDQFKSLPVCSTEKNSQRHGMHMAHKSWYGSIVAHSANRELLVQSHDGGKNSQSLSICDAENKCQPHRIHMTHKSSQENIVVRSTNLKPSLWQNYEGEKSQNLPLGSLDNDERQHGMGVAHSVSPESSVWAHDNRKNSQDDIVSDLLLDSLSEASDPYFSQGLDDSLWDIKIDQLDEFPGESSQSDSSVMHRREPQFAAAFDQSDSRVQLQTNQAAPSHSTLTNQSSLNVQMQTNQSVPLPSTLTNQSDPSIQFQIHQSDFRSVADPQPCIGKRKVTPALMRKSKRAFNCPYTQSTVQEETHTSANVVAQPTHSRSSRGTFKVPLQTSGGVGSFAPEGGGSESPMCGPLRFPSCAEVSSCPTPHRHTVIPHSFTSAHQYRQVLTIAIRGTCMCGQIL